MKMQISSSGMEKAINAVQSAGWSEAVMSLKDDRWMMASQGPANVILAAVLVTEPSMEVYERNGYDGIGLDLNNILEFVKRTDSDLVNMWMNKRTLNIEEDDGNAHVELATIDIDSIEGRVEGGLDVEYEVKFRNDFSMISDFISNADNIINTDHYFIGGRENGLYLYAEHDNGKMDDYYSWDDLDDVEIDWSVDNYADRGHRPAEEHAIDSIMGSDFTKELYHPKDEAHISIGNHFPMRVLYELDNGIKISYFQTPRLPDSDSARAVIPDSIIQKHQ